MSRHRAAPRIAAPADHASAVPAIPRGLRRIAVFRALQLGDLLCAVPAFRALRSAFPDSDITLVGLPWARTFVRRFRRYLDAFMEFPGYPGLPERAPDPRQLPGFFARAQARRFDLVIQMHGSGEVTNPIAVGLGGSSVAGFYRPGAPCPVPGRFLAYPDEEPEISRLQQLMRFLGVHPRGQYLEFPIEDSDYEEARRAGGADLTLRQYACVHPGARTSDRRWPPQGFASVADALAARGLRVVLTGSREEAAITGQVARNMSTPAFDLAGRTSLGGLAALISGARLVVTNDTGISHIADARAVPSVVVCTVSDPRRWAPLDRQKHRMVGAAHDPAHASDVIAASEDLLRAEGLHAA